MCENGRQWQTSDRVIIPVVHEDLRFARADEDALAGGQAKFARALVRGRSYCIADDIHDLAVPVLAHRVRLATHADGFVPSRDEAEAAVRDIVARVPVPL